MTQPKITKGEFENIYISNIPLEDDGKRYIRSLFERVYSLSEAVVAWLWSPATSTGSIYDKIKIIEKELSNFKKGDMSRHFSLPVKLMYSYRKSENDLNMKNQILDLLVESWYEYDRPEIYFLLNK